MRSNAASIFQRILANQHPAARVDQVHVTPSGIRGFTLADDAMIRVNTYVDLISVDLNFCITASSRPRSTSSKRAAIAVVC
jgi:hypothetical protein